MKQKRKHIVQSMILFDLFSAHRLWKFETSSFSRKNPYPEMDYNHYITFNVRVIDMELESEKTDNTTYMWSNCEGILFRTMSTNVAGLYCSTFLSVQAHM